MTIIQEIAEKIIVRARSLSGCRGNTFLDSSVRTLEPIVGENINENLMLIGSSLTDNPMKDVPKKEETKSSLGIYNLILKFLLLVCSSFLEVVLR